jgi:hypothetical protein
MITRSPGEDAGFVGEELALPEADAEAALEAVCARQIVDRIATVKKELTAILTTTRTTLDKWPAFRP